MPESSSSPLFAGRYRFQAVSNDWDRGRSGYTHLVFDILKERLGVIKRAEISSQQAVEGLRNEVGALLDLRHNGLGVPEVYETGETEYGSKNYFYIVIEYIEGFRIEKHLDILSPLERAQILTQFFDLLAKAHNLGIVNGDVDLKHLFWRDVGSKKQLVVIDWGNSKLGVDTKKKTEFAYDLARSAEIIYALVTRNGHPPATGSIALPDDSRLTLGLTPLPPEFRNLCKWAPRTPIVGIQAPHNAQELLQAANEWEKTLRRAKSYRSTKRPKWSVWLFLILIIIAAMLFLGLSPNSPLHPITYSSNSTQTVSGKPSPTVTYTATSTEVASLTPTSGNVSTLTPTILPTFTFSPTSLPTPRIYTNTVPSLIFDNHLNIDNCWNNETSLPDGLKKPNDGFTRRKDNNWRFSTAKDYLPDEMIQADFTQCIQNQELDITALALNIWVTQMELERTSPDNPKNTEAGREFGFFIENKTGQRREYTIWISKDKLLHLRIRENDVVVYDEARVVVNNLKITGGFPRSFAEFSLQVFFEFDNQNLDIIYLQGGSLTQSPGIINNIIPSEVIRVDSAVQPTLGDIQKVGLIGYGGDIQTLIWPLAFLDAKP